MRWHAIGSIHRVEHVSRYRRDPYQPRSSDTSKDWQSLDVKSCYEMKEKGRLPCASDQPLSNLIRSARNVVPPPSQPIPYVPYAVPNCLLVPPCRVHRVRRGHQELREHQEHQEHRALRRHQEHRALRRLRGHQELRAHQEHREHREHQEHQEHRRPPDQNRTASNPDGQGNMQTPGSCVESGVYAVSTASWSPVGVVETRMVSYARYNDGRKPKGGTCRMNPLM